MISPLASPFRGGWRNLTPMRARGRGGQNPWTPGYLSDLRAWYDAELGQPKNVGYVQLDGTAGDYIYTPDSVATSFSNDIEVVMRVKVTDWTAAANQTLAGKYVSTGNQRSWRFYVNTSGAIGLTASADGTALTSIIVTPTNALPDATWIWLRMRLDLTNGSNSVGTLETATDAGTNTEPSSWTANGTNTSTTIASVFDSTAPTEIGTFGSGTLERMTGQVGRCIVRAGFDGTTVADFNASDCYGDGYWHADGYRWNLGLPKIYDRGPNGLAPATFGSGSNQPQWLPWTGRSRVYLPGATGNYVRCPRTASHALADDIEIEIHFDRIFAVGATKVLHASEDGASARHWRLVLNASNVPAFSIFTDGTSGTEVIATATSAITDATRALKITRRRSDGRTQFFTSTSEDDSAPNWVQLGSDVIAGAGSAMYTATSSAYLEIGSRFAGAVDPMVGFVRRFILRSGIDGTKVADFVAASCGQSGHTDTLGNAWLVVRSTSGRKTVVQSPAARSARSVILFGTDDWIDVPAAAVPALDTFQAPTSVVTVFRRWHHSAGGSVFSTKASGTDSVLGTSLRMGTNTPDLTIRVGDGTNSDAPANIASSLGLRAVMNGAVGNSNPFASLTVNGFTPTTDGSRSTALTTSTGGAGRIGAYTGGTGAIDMEFEALICRNAATTDTEHGLQVAYYGGGL